jgi:hypothetical protein
MNTPTVKRWKAKLKTAKLERRQWAKAYNQAERALLRVCHRIDELEKKIELANLK